MRRTKLILVVEKRMRTTGTADTSLLLISSTTHWDGHLGTWRYSWSLTIQTNEFYVENTTPRLDSRVISNNRMVKDTLMYSNYRRHNTQANDLVRFSCSHFSGFHTAVGFLKIHFYKPQTENHIHTYTHRINTTNVCCVNSMHTPLPASAWSRTWLGFWQLWVLYRKPFYIP